MNHLEGIQRQPMPIYVRHDHYNNHNEHQYDPYIIKDDGQLLIDEKWWNTLSHFAQTQIKNNVNHFILGKVETPHESNNFNTSDLLGIVYRAYLESFDYHLWYSPLIPDAPKDVTMIRLEKEQKVALSLRETEAYCLDDLKEKLATICCGKEYFVRLSGTSGKNEKGLRPFKSAEEIVKHLSSVDQFHNREYKRNKETYVILMPWNEEISSRNEFRIFVVENKVTAASPQKFWELHQYTTEELEAFEHALNNISFIGHVPYHTFVADIYIDVTTAKAHLIELNPFGAHSGAGASFFNWIDDYETLHGLSTPKLRYMSAINY